MGVNKTRCVVSVGYAPNHPYFLGLHNLNKNIPMSTNVQIAIIWFITFFATISVVSGKLDYYLCNSRIFRVAVAFKEAKLTTNNHSIIYNIYFFII